MRSDSRRRLSNPNRCRVTSRLLPAYESVVPRAAAHMPWLWLRQLVLLLLPMLQILLLQQQLLLLSPPALRLSS